MSLIIECNSFTATSLGDGKFRLEVQQAEKKAPADVYEAAQATERLTTLLGRKVCRHNLAYWRKNLSLPHNKVGPKKFLYKETELQDWVNSRRGAAF